MSDTHAKIDAELATFIAFVNKIKPIVDFVTTNKEVRGLELVVPGGVAFAEAMGGLDFILGLISKDESMIRGLAGMFQNFVDAGMNPMDPSQDPHEYLRNMTE
jgi:hypothetical protein